MISIWKNIQFIQSDQQNTTVRGRECERVSEGKKMINYKLKESQCTWPVATRFSDDWGDNKNFLGINTLPYIPLFLLDILASLNVTHNGPKKI